LFELEWSKETSTSLRTTANLPVITFTYESDGEIRKGPPAEVISASFASIIHCDALHGVRIASTHKLGQSGTGEEDGYRQRHPIHKQRIWYGT